MNNETQNAWMINRFNHKIRIIGDNIPIIKDIQHIKNLITLEDNDDDETFLYGQKGFATIMIDNQDSIIRMTYAPYATTNFEITFEDYIDYEAEKIVLDFETRMKLYKGHVGG